MAICSCISWSERPSKLRRGCEDEGREVAKEVDELGNNMEGQEADDDGNRLEVDAMV